MKKLLILMISAALALTLFACDQAESTQDTESQASSSEQSDSADDSETPDLPEGVIVGDIPDETGDTQEDTDTSGATNNFTAGVVVGSENLQIGMTVSEDTLTALGAPVETQQAPSCHFDGNDTIHIFNGLTTYLYKDGENDVLYLIELTSDAYTTALGAKVGMSKDEVISMYGDSYEELGTRYSYTLMGEMVDFTFDEAGVVTMIEVLEP